MNIGFTINCCLVLICVVSVIMDVLTWKISNIWLFTWMIVGVVFKGLLRISGGFAGALLGILVPVLILGVFFYFRMIGAGDIKLFCALGAWMGPGSILMCMLWSFAAAGVMAVISLLMNKNTKERFRYLGDHVRRLFGSAVKVDYGIKNAGKARIHVSIPILIGIICKIIGVYA